MKEAQINLGRKLLKSLVNLRGQKGALSLEDIGGIFMQIASSINPGDSRANYVMHEEIARLAQYITDAKREIFAISVNEKSEAIIADASLHLDVVIKETEQASHSIMDAADAIQEAATGIGGDREQQIMEATKRIYEACNFQDITGQRINKVIKLLNSIEERIRKLNSMFSSAEDGADIVNIPAATDDKDLLSGPQLSGKGSTQEEIDMLFASLGGNK